LLAQVNHHIGRFIGDGIFDQAPVYTAVEHHSPGALVIIPPRKDAVVSPTAMTAPTQRDQRLLAIKNAGRFAWKRTSGYDAQSHAENAFSRYKRTFGGGLGRSGMRLRSGKSRSRARCSIGCESWVVRSPLRSAESGVQRTIAASGRFMQQSPAHNKHQRAQGAPCLRWFTTIRRYSSGASLIS
jgi:hypothetical protein